MENESSVYITHLTNIYTDGEKYYYVLYNDNKHKYYFSDGYDWDDEAERAANKKIKEIENDMQ